MENPIVKITPHFGYRIEFVHLVGKPAFVIYNLSKMRIVAAYLEEKEAGRTCRYLEALNYGDLC